MSEESEGELYDSNEKSNASTQEQELQECVHLIESDELKNSIIEMIKIVAKMKMK